MSKTNFLIFEELNEFEFHKSNGKAVISSPKMALFPHALGYDYETGGFLVFHKDHAWAAIPEEIPACLILKKLGMGVILLSETAGQFVPDAQIGNRYFEIKRMSNAKNIRAAIHDHFRKAKRKSANILLHVDQPVQPDSLRSAIWLATQQNPEIRSVWVIFLKELWQLDRQVILKNDFKFR